MTNRSVQQDSGWEHRPVALDELGADQEPTGSSDLQGGRYGNWRRSEIPPEAFNWSREGSSPRTAGIRSIGWVRMVIALSFVICFGLVLYLGYRATGTKHWQNSSEWFQAALPATVSLLGSALGFYYGDKRNDR
jgi:hypothetical protein